MSEVGFWEWHLASACKEWTSNQHYPQRSRDVLAVCNLSRYKAHGKRAWGSLGCLAFHGFQVYLPAFLVGNLLHRFPLLDPTAPLFKQPRGSSATAGTSQAKIVLHITDTAPLTLPGYLSYRETAGQGLPPGIPPEMGSCQGVITAPPHPFQASAVAPNRIMPVEGVGTLKIPLIDNYRFEASWDPEKAAPPEDKAIVGFQIPLDSTDLTPVPAKPFESLSRHVNTAPPSPESEDEFLASWPSSSPSGPSY